jgi:hypothetical protein
VGEAQSLAVDLEHSLANSLVETFAPAGGLLD